MVTSRERKVLDEEVEYLGPVAIAMFVELGWIRLWPMSWSRPGIRALQNGFGHWEGLFQKLPDGWHMSPTGAAYWARRRHRIPVGTNIPLRQQEAA